MVMPADTPAWLRHVLEDLARAQARTDEQLNRLAAAQARSEERFAAVEGQLGQLAQQVARLAAAQERTEERLDRLAAAQGRTEERLDQLTQQVTHLAEAQQRTEERLDRLAAAQERTEERLNRQSEQLAQHTDQLGRLTGMVWEAHFKGNAPGFFAQIGVRGVQVLTPPLLDQALSRAMKAGQFTRDDAEQLRLADLVCRGRDAQTDRPVVVVVEVSASVAVHDVERAAARARLAARLGESAIAVVAGQRIDRDAQALAEQTGVRQIIATE